MSEMYVNYGSFDSWAATIDTRNKALLEELHEIKQLINSLAGEWESNAAAEIRRKITNMEPRFEDYYSVVDNYAKFLRNTAADYKKTEQTNTTNAEQFV